MFLFSGSNLSAHATQNLYIHNISGNGRKPVKKIIPNHASLLLAMKPDEYYPAWEPPENFWLQSHPGQKISSTAPVSSKINRGSF